jgi:phosphate transport system substrate-binding protein
MVRGYHFSLWVAVLAITGLSFIETSMAQPRTEIDPAIASYVPVPDVTGRLTISGSETMQPLLIRLAAEFRRRYPGIGIGVEGGGSAAAIAGFLESMATVRRGDGADEGHAGSYQVQILASSRELSPEENHQFTSRHGHAPTGIPIAIDAVAVYVHRNNPLPGLTLQQLDAIFSRDRKRGFPRRIGRWGDVGLSGEWERAEVHLYGRDLNSGTRQFFEEHVLQAGSFSGSIIEEPGQASLMLALSRDRAGIGYGSIGYLASAVRMVPLVEREGGLFVAPSAQSVAEGSYPLQRLLYLYINKHPGKVLSPVVREFLAFANSRQGQEIVIQSGFYPLASTQVERNRAAMLARYTP